MVKEKRRQNHEQEKKSGNHGKGNRKGSFFGNMSIERANEVYREEEKKKKTLREMIEETARNDAQLACDRELNKRFSEGE